MRRFLLLSVCGAVLSTSALAFDTTAKHAFLIDADTGYVMYEKDASIPMAPASMSKLMTVYMIFDALKSGKIQQDDEFLVSENAWKTGGVKSGSSTMFLNPGERVKVRDLLRGIIVQSGNDACIVAAEGLAGSEDVFATMMEKKARKLGLKDSTFRNSTGLPNPEHLMSSKDLALLAQALIRDFPEYYSIFAEREFTHNGIRQPNRNPLLGTLDGADGLKTGHTNSSGFGLTGSVKTRDGRRLIMVLNGMKSMKERGTESQKVMGYGISNFENVTVFDKEQVVENIPVWYGESATVEAIPADKTIMTIARGHGDEVVSKIIYDTPVLAPIEAGQKLGEIVISAEGYPEQHIDMIAKKSVEKLGFFGTMKKNFAKIFGK